MKVQASSHFVAKNSEIEASPPPYSKKCRDAKDLDMHNFPESRFGKSITEDLPKFDLFYDFGLEFYVIGPYLMLTST